MSTRDDWASRQLVVGLIRHTRRSTELARSQSRVRLSVSAWLQELTLAEVFELEPDGGPPAVMQTLNELGEVAIEIGARLVLTLGLSQDRAVEDSLLWFGLRAWPLERWPDGDPADRNVLPIPRQHPRGSRV